MRKKSLAMLLTLVMLLGLVSPAALAAEPGAEEEPVVLTVEEPQEYTADFATAAPVPSLMAVNSLAETGDFTSFGDQLANSTNAGYAQKIYQALCAAINGNEIRNGQPISVTLEEQNFDGTNQQEIADFVNSANSKATEMYAAARDAAAAFDRDHSDVFWTSGVKSQPFAAQNGTHISDTYSPTAGTYSIGVDVTLPLSVSWQSGGRNITQDIGTVTAAVQARANAARAAGDDYYTQLKTVHDWLTHNNAYNTAAATAGNSTDSTPWEAISALTGDTSLQPVCEGYARAFKLICDELRIPCVLVSGKGNGGEHMWNYVQMEDDKWYAVDVTWDDPTGGVNETSNESGDESDEYFLVGSTKLNADHTAQSNNFMQGGNYEFAYPTLSTTDYTRPKEVDTITVSAEGETTVAVPKAGATTEINLTAMAAYVGDVSTSEDVTTQATWTVVGSPVAGVSVGEKTGVVTIQPTAGEYSKETTVTVQAAYGGKTGTIAITLTKEAQQVKTITVTGKTSIQAPGSETYTAAGVDQYGAPMTPNVTWSVEGTPTGVTIDAQSGVLTVENTAASGSVTVKATDSASSVTGTLPVQITAASAVATTVEITSAGSVAVPTVDEIGGTANETLTLTATVKDQFDKDMSGAQVTWAIKGTAPAGVSLSGDVLTVTNQAAGGTVTVTATCDTKTAEQTISITKAPQAVTFIAIEEGAADTIIIPGSGSPDAEKTYTAKTYDQYGVEFGGDATTWSTEGTLPAGVTHDNNGKITVSNGATEGTFTLVAANNGHEARIEITVSTKPAPGLSRKDGGDDITVTYGETATGHTAAATSTGKITYSSDNPAVEVNPDTGALAIKGATTTPATIKATIEETADYAGASITYQVTVNQKELEITGLTAENRAYIAGNTSVTLTGGTLSGIVGNDDVTCVIPTSGTMADADAGTNKPVAVTTPSLEGANAGNYTLKAITGITVNIDKAKPDVGTVSKTSPATIFTSTSSDGVTLSCDGTDAGNGTLALDSTTFTVGTKAYGWTFTPDDKNNYEVVTGTIELTVEADTLESIEIATNPDKTEYKFGETFDPTGMVVKATFASGAEIDPVSLDQLSYSKDPLAVGTDKITISYTNNGVTKTADVTITVAKADATAAMQSANGTIMANQSGSVNLNLPEGATATIQGSAPAEVVNAKVDGSTLTYTGSEDVKDGTKYTVTISVTSTNYNDYEIEVTLTGTDKITPTGSPTLSTTTLTYGQTLSEITLSGSMQGESAMVAGTFTWNAPNTVPNAGTYTAVWTFTPSDTTRYTTATGSVTITVNKATPTGAPKYTAISTSGKTLKDAGLTTEGGTFSVPGTVAWELDETTAVQANTYYKWIFTPDSSNYEQLTGTIQLWHRSSSGGGSSSGGSSSGGNKTETDTNPDGSTTTTVTSSNGTVTETTKYPDGSKEVVETKKDGTVTTTVTDKAGNETETVENPDGSSRTTVDNANGSGSVTTVSEDGQVSASVNLPLKVIEDAAEQGEAVTLPMPSVPNAYNRADAATVTVDLPAGRSARVEIPVARVTSGTVAILVGADGTETVLRTSLTTADGVTATLSDGDTVKIVDNSKTFSDVSNSYWAVDAINFATSRELFAGNTATTFNPAGTTNRQQVWMVLARLEGNSPANMSAAKTWAVDNGISDGSNPTGTMTRQQLATMLYRYAQSKGLGFTGQWAYQLDFTDVASVSSYAYEAMCWMNMNGIIGGMGDGTLNPQGSATRAQVAAILQRFVTVVNG